MADLLTIGEVSRRSGVASSALRFYEEEALAYLERAVTSHQAASARVTVHASATEIAGRLPPYGRHSSDLRPQLEELARDDDLGWLAIRIALLGVDVEVLEPPSG